MTMRLTILGASAAAQNPGGACSSYLVRHEQARDDSGQNAATATAMATTVVLDMGSGAFANLQRHIVPDAVDAIVLSHVHADHCLDLVPYRYALSFLAQQGQRAPRRPRLWLPPGGHERLLAIVHGQDPSPTFFQDVFEVAEYDPAQTLQVGGLHISFGAVNHAPHTYGMRVEDTAGPRAGNTASGATLAYSADTGPCPALLDLARDADLFLCENANSEDSAYPLHLAPSQAGAYARDAGARRLALTHRWHGYGFDEAVQAAGRAFDGPISVAREGDTYDVSR